MDRYSYMAFNALRQECANRGVPLPAGVRDNQQGRHALRQALRQADAQQQAAQNLNQPPAQQHQPSQPTDQTNTWQWIAIVAIVLGLIGMGWLYLRRVDITTAPGEMSAQATRIAQLEAALTRTPTSTPAAVPPSTPSPTGTPTATPAAPTATNTATATPRATAMVVLGAYPKAGVVYKSPQGDAYNATWNSEGWLHQPNLPEKPLRGAHAVSFTILPGTYFFNGVECQLFLDESRKGDGGSPSVGFGNGKRFTVTTADGGEAWGRTECRRSESSGFSIEWQR